jgi:hypothetical protein
MEDAAHIQGIGSNKEEQIKCPICSEYFIFNEGFYCPHCKKGPLCKKHRVPGGKECISCRFEIMLNETKLLCRQEKNMKSFIRFLQFLFIVLAILFITLKFGILEDVKFLTNNIFTKNLPYIGIGTILLHVIFYIILFNQKQKMIKLESEMKKIEIGKYY